jgi:hypothetical protein
MPRLLIRTLLGWTCSLTLSFASPAPPIPTSSPETRPWTRWWWPGSAVSNTGITVQLEAFAAAGIGGVEITPIYGAKGAEEDYRPFLSPTWMAALAHTTKEAHRLGLKVDMATGTGWPFGGPGVPPADGSQGLALDSAGDLTGLPTGMKVKRAAPGGAGLVLDPYSTAALERYLSPIGVALDTLPAVSLRAQFHDSFEYYGAEWTPRLAEVFEVEHGYPLNSYARELMGDVVADPDTLARLKADYRSTLGRLHLNYLNTWRDWSHARGWLVRNQSHGAPANLLDLYGAVDIPETETFGSTPFKIPGLRREESETRGNDDLPEPLMMKMASSAAHVMGRPLISSETCTWLREHWKVSLAMAKPEIDRLFANGINHIFYHGAVYSPPEVPWPGWLFYASTQFNPHNPWWDDFAALNAYVTRVQSALQSGEPDNEILLYWPYADVVHDPEGKAHLLTVHHVDWLTESPFGHAARQLTAGGYTFDYISDDQLSATHVNEDGLLATPGHRYRMLVVPPVEHLPLPSLRQLISLARAGASIQILATPADVPGLGNLAARRSEFTALMAELRTLAADPRLALTINPPSAPELDANFLRDRVTSEPMATSGLEFIRRRTTAGWVYFIANLTASDFDGWLPLGVAAQDVILTDPLTGRVGRPDLRTKSLAVRLQLASGQSVLLTANTRPLPPAAPWSAVSPLAPAVPLTGEWSLAFLSGGPTLPPAQTLSAPVDWTTLGDPAAQRFGGTARYQLTFTLPPAPADTTDWLLDLGDVRESARIRLNGETVATSWSLPHRLRIGSHLRPGVNVIEIDVTNLAANRIRDLDRRGIEWRIMHEINFVNIHYRPFDASSWSLTPSGLLGPVTLTPLKSP